MNKIVIYRAVSIFVVIIRNHIYIQQIIDNLYLKIKWFLKEKFTRSLIISYITHIVIGVYVMTNDVFLDAITLFVCRAAQLCYNALGGKQVL